jgi:hypothetical protein
MVTLLGTLVGNLFLPLDAGVLFQRWPTTLLVGDSVGNVLGRVVSTFLGTSSYNDNKVEEEDENKVN